MQLAILVPNFCEMNNKKKEKRKEKLFFANNNTLCCTRYIFENVYI